MREIKLLPKLSVKIKIKGLKRANNLVIQLVKFFGVSNRDIHSSTFPSSTIDL